MNNADQYAFPKSVSGYEGHQGLTKREYFAGLAMQGMASSYAGHHSHPDPVTCAKKAVRLADELLNELEKPQPHD